MTKNLVSRFSAARRVWLAIIGPMLLSAAPLSAEIVNAAPDGFVLRIERQVIAPDDIAWRMLVGHVGEWWHGDHTYSGDASNLYIEERPLGCFCERLGATDAVVHMTVTAIDSGSLLRLTGGLGPLGLMGVNGNMTFSLSADGTATVIALEYRVGGYHPEGLDNIAPAVDAVLSTQLDRFVRFVESGSPEPASSAPMTPDDLQG